MVRDSLSCALSLALCGVAITLFGCEQALDAAQGGCELSFDCARGERCEDGRCVPTVSADGEDDGGPSTLDGGADGVGSDDGTDGGAVQGCVPDALGNDSPASAAVGIDGEHSVEGHLCAVAPAYVAVEGTQGDGLQVFLVWDAYTAPGLDLNLKLAGPTDSEGVSIAATDIYGAEAASVVLAKTGRHLAQIDVSGTLPEAGVDYGFEWRAGSPCRIDADCVGVGEVCLMPRWAPSAATGESPPSVMIFRAGVCAEPFSGCSPDLADGAEGSADHRDEAHEGLAAGNVYACQGDEDWYRITSEADGHVSLIFRQVATQSATYLVTVYDEHGNNVQGAGYRALASQLEQQLRVPFVSLGTELWVRVLLLSDDPLGAYELTTTTEVTACLDDAECASTPEASEYGRIRCVAGACTCPEQECTPAP